MKHYLVLPAAAVLALAACSDKKEEPAAEVVVAEETTTAETMPAEDMSTDAPAMEESNTAEIVNDDLVVEEGYLAEGESQGTVTIE